MKKLLLVMLSLLFLTAVAETVEARYLEYPELIIQVEIREDGSALVSEQRTIVFHGRYEGFYQYIHINKGIDIENVRVREGEHDYLYNPAQTEGPPGTYFTRRDSNQLFVDWSVDAVDEVKFFTLEYEITNLVSVYDDYATFYHKFVGDEWAEGVGNLVVNISFPRNPEREQVMVWAYGPDQGRSLINNDGSITLTVENLPPYRFVESRVLFPRELVSASVNRFSGDIAPLIAREAEKWEKELLAARRGRSVSAFLSILLSFLPLVILIISYAGKYREKKKYFLKNGQYFRDLPSEISPVLVIALLNKNNIKSMMNRGISASILKLAVDGFIFIEEKVEKKFLHKKATYHFKLLKKEGFGELDLYEKLIFSMLFEVISPDGTRVTTEDIKKFNQASSSTLKDISQSLRALFAGEPYMVMHNNKQLKQLQELSGKGGFAEMIARMAATELRLSLSLLIKNLSQQAEKDLNMEYRYINKPKPGLYSVLSGIAMIAFSIAAYKYIFTYSDLTNGDWPALLAIGGISLSFWAVITLALDYFSPWTETGKEEYYKWLAFKNYLRHFSRLEEKTIPHIAVWDKYLVYATAMGVAKEVIDSLKKIYPEAADTSNRSWCSVTAGANIFSSSTFASSMSGALPSSGGGGGMSGGGGGGSGGGGGGGR